MIRRRTIKEKLINLLINNTLLSRKGPKGKPRYPTRLSGIRKTLSNADYATNYNRIQCLGVGSSIQNIEYYFNQIAQSNTQYGISIGQILTGSSEFVDKMTHYRYFKILGLVVVFEPSYIGTGAEYVRVQLNWNENEADNMSTEDSTKIVPFYRTRRITLKYKMPNMECLDTNGYINYTSWITREIYNLNAEMPGTIWFSSTTGSQYAIVSKIVLRVAFRGSVSVTPSSLTKELELINKINSNNINNNIKETSGFKKILINNNEIKNKINPEVPVNNNKIVSQNFNPIKPYCSKSLPVERRNSGNKQQLDQKDTTFERERVNLYPIKEENYAFNQIFDQGLRSLGMNPNPLNIPSSKTGPLVSRDQESTGHGCDKDEDSMQNFGTVCQRSSEPGALVFGKP